MESFHPVWNARRSPAKAIDNPSGETLFSNAAACCRATGHPAHGRAQAHDQRRHGAKRRRGSLVMVGFRACLRAMAPSRFSLKPKFVNRISCPAAALYAEI
jgi:hypothetical protein